MIGKIENIKNFGIFDNFEWSSDDLFFLHTNIMYGPNGSGKTTFSNLLSIKSNQISKEEKAEISSNTENNGLELECKILDNEDKQIKEDQKILIFNSHFVSGHVFEGNISKFKNFKNNIVTKESLQNPEIKKILNEISKENEKLEIVNKEVENIEETAKKIADHLSKKFNVKLDGKRLTKENILNYKDKKEDEYGDSLVYLNSQIDHEIRKYKISKNDSKLEESINLLKKNKFEKIIFEKSVENFLNTKISSNVFHKIKHKINKIKNIKLEKCSHQDWFEFGFEILKNKKSEDQCPLCDNKLENIEALLGEYNRFFSNEFKEFQKNSILLQDDLVEIERIVKESIKFISNIKKIINNYSFEDLNDEIYGIDEEYQFKYILDNIKDLKEIILEKTKDFDMHQTEVEYGYVGQSHYCRKVFNEIIYSYEIIQEELLKKLDESNFDEKNTRQLFKKYFWTELFNEIKPKFEDYLKINSDELLGLAFVKSVYEEKENLESNLKKLEIEKETQLAKLKKESEFVNYYLKRLNINHFEIKTNNEEKFKSIKILFKETKQKKTEIKYSLSDGEKTALSFAYFLSKIRHEIINNEEDNLSNYIVVIDDPISSLDENRLFSTALLIKDFFSESVRQLFILSHNLIFLKFIGNIINKKNKERQDFLLENGEILKLPKLLQNYQTSYFHKIEKIQFFIDGDIDYELAKEFIPNYIRIVLEAFLSFKLCKLSNKNKYRSAGISDLISSLKTISLEAFEKNDLINPNNLIEVLSDIKGKIDPECHGTTQDITDIKFISENDLKNISKQTISIIDFLDQLHLSKIKEKIGIDNA